MLCLAGVNLRVREYTYLQEICALVRLSKLGLKLSESGSGCLRVVCPAIALQRTHGKDCQAVEILSQLCCPRQDFLHLSVTILAEKRVRLTICPAHWMHTKGPTAEALQRCEKADTVSQGLCDLQLVIPAKVDGLRPKAQIERHDGHWAPQAHCRTFAATRVFCAYLKSQKALLWLLSRICEADGKSITCFTGLRLNSARGRVGRVKTVTQSAS